MTLKQLWLATMTVVITAALSQPVAWADLVLSFSDVALNLAVSVVEHLFNLVASH